MAHELKYPFRMWFWIVTDPATKQRTQTGYHMTEAEAFQRDPSAEKVELGAIDIKVPGDAPRAVALSCVLFGDGGAK